MAIDDFNWNFDAPIQANHSSWQVDDRMQLGKKVVAA